MITTLLFVLTLLWPVDIVPTFVSTSSEDGALILKGEVNEAMYEQVLAYTGKVIRVDSPGGSVLWGTRIAEVLIRRDLEVQVMGQCMSACFSYIFIPASRRVVGAGSVLGLHVGPITLLQVAEEQGRGLPAWDSELSHRMREVLRKREVSEALFKELARRLNVSLVDGALSCNINDAPGAPMRTMPCQRISSDASAWYLETSQLERFGIPADGPEINYRTINDIPLRVLLLRFDEAAYFGDCLYQPQQPGKFSCLDN